MENSCELLSELYFYLWFPTIQLKTPYTHMLWIAFRIVFLLMIPNFRLKYLTLTNVVNCFQNCIFTYDSQLQFAEQSKIVCCELLSELYFYLWFPTICINWTIQITLWIAFRIVFLLMIPNGEIMVKMQTLVVNCFQNCIFTYDSQPLVGPETFPVCCELLSELYFYLYDYPWLVPFHRIN